MGVPGGSAVASKQMAKCFIGVVVPLSAAVTDHSPVVPFDRDDPTNTPVSLRYTRTNREARVPLESFVVPDART